MDRDGRNEICEMLAEIERLQRDAQNDITINGDLFISTKGTVVVLIEKILAILQECQDITMKEGDGNDTTNTAAPNLRSADNGKCNSILFCEETKHY